MRRATVALTPMESPIASVYTIAMSDSVRPTVATASAPSLPTKNTSQMTKMDSIAISSTIGMASTRIARPMGPSV